MAVAVSRSGQYAATGSWDRTVRIWNLASGREVTAISHPSPVNAVVFGAGDKVVVSGSHDGKLRAWSVPDGRPLGKVAGHEMGIAQLAVSTDGKSLLSAGIDEKLKLWELADFREVRTFAGHEGQIYGAAFSPDGATALSSGSDGQVIHWNLATGKPIRFIRAHEKLAWAVAYAPGGRFALSASSDESVRVWHLETGDRIGIPAEGASEPKPWLTSAHPGAKLFRKCANCHSLSANEIRRSGPHFAGLFGRRAGSVTGYNYSQALDGAEFLWNEVTLQKLFERGPDVFLPGTKMPLQRIPDLSQLGELIAYLRELTAPAPVSGPAND
jgi:cytochrome c